MLGIYFSGTGNTAHAVKTFVSSAGEGGETVSLENSGVKDYIRRHGEIVLGYPVYFSNTPKIVADFILQIGDLWADKKIFIIATMGMFSGDGAGCGARLFKKFRAEVVGGLHVKMPDNIGDSKMLKKSDQENKRIVLEADEKITSAARMLKEGTPPRDGLGLPAHAAGLLGQRLWFYSQTNSYKKKPDIYGDKCTGCGRCAQVCPMKNMAVENKKAVSGARCTLCYRCFSECPTAAITVLGRKVHDQYRFEKFFPERESGI